MIGYNFFEFWNFLCFKKNLFIRIFTCGISGPTWMQGVSDEWNMALKYLGEDIRAIFFGSVSNTRGYSLLFVCYVWWLCLCSIFLIVKPSQEKIEPTAFISFSNNIRIALCEYSITYSNFDEFHFIFINNSLLLY